MWVFEDSGGNTKWTSLQGALKITNCSDSSRVQLTNLGGKFARLIPDDIPRNGLNINEHLCFTAPTEFEDPLRS